MLIVAILASIAYPTYRDTLYKARRTDAQSSLMAFANAMERYYSQTNTYLGAGLSGANTGTPGIFVASAPLGGGVATYELTLNNATATTFTLVATPVGLQVLDKCGALTLTETGVKGVVNAANGFDVNRCW